MQGLAPTFIAGLSDASGRRIAYLACFVIYLAANLGLALQTNYAALMVLRCLQSGGSSATVALAQAVAADVVTSQERGKYVSYMSIAPQVGPALGPIIGGLLAQYLGWHSIFWFLMIVAGVIFIPVALVFPETCRNVVEDGSVPPPKWSRCYMNSRLERRLEKEGQVVQYQKTDELARERKLRFPNPLVVIRIIFTKEAGFALIYIAIVCCGIYVTVALIPSQFGSIYGFNEIQIALCYLPFGAGTASAAFVRGRIIDSRFRAHAKRLGYPLEYNRRLDLSDFPIERARIEVALPTICVGSAFIIAFGWMVQAKVNLAGPLIFLYVIGFCVSASLNSIAVLLIDLFPGRPGSASAANNLCRCWLGAAGTSAIVPMINTLGLGWTTTFWGLLPIVTSPLLWYIMVNGPKWRKATKAKQDRLKADKAAKADVGGEKGTLPKVASVDGKS